MIVQAMFFVHMTDEAEPGTRGPLRARCPDLPGLEVAGWDYPKLWTDAATEACFFATKLMAGWGEGPTFRLDHTVPNDPLPSYVAVLSVYMPDEVFGT